MLRVRMFHIGNVRPRPMWQAENSVTGKAETIGGRACFGSLVALEQALAAEGYRAGDHGEWTPEVLENIVRMHEHYGDRNVRKRGVTIKRLSLG